MKPNSTDLEFVTALKNVGLTRGDAMDILAGHKEKECQAARDTLKRRMMAVINLYDR